MPTGREQPVGIFVWEATYFSLQFNGKNLYTTTYPMRLAPNSVNQIVLPGPAVIPFGWLLGVGIVNLAIAPVRVMRPMTTSC